VALKVSRRASADILLHLRQAGEHGPCAKEKSCGLLFIHQGEDSGFVARKADRPKQKTRK
jgi:hypothetical protein